MTNPVMKLIEECAELQKALCKAERFGWKNEHPRRKITNLQHVAAEIQDVLDAIEVLQDGIPELWEEG